MYSLIPDADGLLVVETKNVSGPYISDSRGNMISVGTKQELVEAARDYLNHRRKTRPWWKNMWWPPKGEGAARDIIKNLDIVK